MDNLSSQELVSQPYKYGFVTDIEEDKIAKGVNEDVVRWISAKREEPQYLLDFRLRAYKHWLSMAEPDWPKLGYPPIDYQDIIYYAAPKKMEKKTMGNMEEYLFYKTTIMGQMLAI